MQRQFQAVEFSLSKLLRVRVFLFRVREDGELAEGKALWVDTSWGLKEFLQSASLCLGLSATAGARATWVDSGVELDQVPIL